MSNLTVNPVSQVRRRLQGIRFDLAFISGGTDANGNERKFGTSGLPLTIPQVKWAKENGFSSLEIVVDSVHEIDGESHSVRLTPEYLLEPAIRQKKKPEEK